MTPELYEAYRARALKCARGDPREPAGLLLKDLYCQPGFAAIRSQVGRIVALFRREFRRRHRRGVAPPALPRLGYVQRLPTTGIRLVDLLDSRIARTPEHAPRLSGTAVGLSTDARPS